MTHNDPEVRIVDTTVLSQPHTLRDAQFDMHGGVRCGWCGEHEDDPVHDAYPKVTHVAIGQGVFYNATSEEAAKAGFRREGGRISKPWSMVHFPEGVTYLGVSMMGSMRWRYDTEPHVEPIRTDYHQPKG